MRWRDKMYINEYLSAIQNILPIIDKEVAKQILPDEVKIEEL